MSLLPRLSAAQRRALLIPLRALQLGAAYAVKVRLPHALVMAVLFGGGDRRPVPLLRRIVGLAWEHAKLLAAFAFLYKAGIGAGRAAYDAAGFPPSSPPGVPAAPWHAFAAGALAAKLVWAPYSHLSYQILLYLLSRTLVGGARLAAKRGVPPFSLVSFSAAYPALAVAVWGTAMWLYEADPGCLHPSLTASMNDIYRCVTPPPEVSRGG